MKKSQIFAYSFVALLALAVGGMTIASAHGPGWFGEERELSQGKQIMLEEKAELFGLTTEELQAKLNAGQNFQEIADELGITREDIHEHMLEEHTDRLNQMVADNVITQEQADERLAHMQEWQEKIASGECPGPGAFEGLGRPSMGMGGMHHFIAE